ncbi:hypothetical protein HWV62_38624 [Athelia sp. TMB]|nr:hypothetical protein HWV62_38624 [Athelia sp. TMB]
MYSQPPIVDTDSSDILSLNSRRMELSDLTIVRKIGQGGSAKVFQVQDKITHNTLALKVISKKNLNSDLLKWTLIEQKTLLANTGSPHLLSLDASFHDSKNFYLATPFAPLGDLHSEIERCCGLTVERARFYMAELILGLESLHGQGIIHRDIKPANLLIDPTGHLLLADFGLSRNFDADPEPSSLNGTDVPLGLYTTQTCCGTLNFMSPELIAGRPYSFSADLWAAAITLYFMICGKAPWDSKVPREVIRLIYHTSLSFDEKHGPDPITRNFLLRMTEVHPMDRMTMQELKTHPFFRWGDFNWEAVTTGTQEAPVTLAKLDRNPVPTPGLRIPDGQRLKSDPFPEFTFTSPRMACAATYAQAEEVERYCMPLDKRCPTWWKTVKRTLKKL